MRHYGRLKMTKVLLTYRGYWVTGYANPKAARNLLARNVYQLIIARIHNQEENLFSFTRSLRSEGNYALIIFMGERAYEEAIRRRLTGLDECLLRPYTGAGLDLVLE
jgi:DNA-binding response OmpR family regulator